MCYILFICYYYLFNPFLTEWMRQRVPSRDDLDNFKVFLTFFFLFPFFANAVSDSQRQVYLARAIFNAV